MNILLSSGEILQLSIGETYTLKDNEVYINNQLYNKADLEIVMNNNSDDADAKTVRVGIKLRSDRLNLPATLTPYTNWKINNSLQSSLSDLVENINTSIQ